MRALGWFEPRPMYLGLDLRGGVHFLLQVDMQSALTARYDSLAGDVRTTLPDEKVPTRRAEHAGTPVVATFSSDDDTEPGYPTGTQRGSRARPITHRPTVAITVARKTSG